MVHPRFSDDLSPRLIYAPDTYPGTSDGPVRRARLTDRAGTPVGTVWTDGRAAGWLPAEATPATARAGAFVWKVLQLAYRRGVPAGEVLDPKLYAPLYQLGEPEHAETPSA